MDKNDLKLELLASLSKIKSDVSRKRGLNINGKFRDVKPLDNQIIDNLGGNVVVAALCDVSVCTVSYWRKVGIPEGRILKLQNLSLKAQ